MKKGILGILLLSLVLAGCSSNSTAKKESTNESSSTVKTTSSSTRAKASATKIGAWTTQKDTELSSFIKQWEKVMDQTYTQYTGENNLTTANGTVYPTEFKTATVDGQPAELVWDPKGTQKVGYAVVALYNYNKNTGGSITYAFTIKDGTPIVLVNETNTASNNWTQTKNNDLKENFANIYNGRPTTTVGSANEKTATDDAYSDGRNGYITTPVAMRGTWYAKSYGKMSKLEVSEHEIVYTSEGEKPAKTILYRPGNGRKFDTDSAVQEARQEWGVASEVTKNDLNYINVRGWYQTAGAGTFYAAHTELIDGKQTPVVVVGGGAGAWTSTVYYQTEALAEQQAEVKYDDLIYQ